MRFVATAILLAATPATAGRAVSNDPILPLAPQSITARLDGTSVLVTTRFRVTAGESREIRMPEGGVVTSATITHGGVAHRLKIEARAEVDRVWDEAFDTSANAEGDTWVARIDQSSMNGSNQLAAVTLTIGAPFDATAIVDLEILAPTCFDRDTRYAVVPDEWHQKTTLRADNACGVKGDAVLAYPTKEASKLASGDRIAMSTARLVVDDDLHIARAEVTFATTLADIPADLATVILVDESRSMTTEQRTAQRALVAAYLRAAPNSRVQVMAFARKSRPIVSAWTNARFAAPRVERELVGLGTRNGSNFDVALAAAARVLEHTTGTRRVLLVTDEAMSTTLAQSPERHARVLPQGTVLQVAVIGAGTGDHVTRDDDAVLAPLAAATEGIAVQAHTTEKTLDATILVRPLSFDNVRISGLGWHDMGSDAHHTAPPVTCANAPELLAGTTCSWWSIGSKFAGPIQLEGMLWNRRIVRLAKPLGDANRTIAREMASRGVLPRQIPNRTEDVDLEKLSAKLDVLADAVTQTTTLYGRWGGPKKLKDEVNYSYFGMSGGGPGGNGVMTGFGTGRLRTITSLDLTPQIDRAVKACGGRDLEGRVEIELTFDEIVRVAVTLTKGARPLASCIEEALWETELQIPVLEPSRTVAVSL